MSEQLTPRDFEMIEDALYQRSANADTEREEDRWLTLRAKIERMALVELRTACRCGHARDKHRYATEIVSTCRICQCESFDRGPVEVPLEAARAALNAFYPGYATKAPNGWLFINVHAMQAAIAAAVKVMER